MEGHGGSSPVVDVDGGLSGAFIVAVVAQLRGGGDGRAMYTYTWSTISVYL